MSTSKRAGKVITFYSYKGGTGRSMALANLAWVFASNGLDVLLIDWDLEAPGLHRYFRPFLVDSELHSTPGLIDYLWDAAKRKMTPVPEGQTGASGGFPSLEDYVVGLDWDFGEKGSISLLPAGRQDENYAQRVNTFDWDNFYDRLGGGKLLHAARDELRGDYDYIFIDSRTGVSDTSGICTVQMPDSLVVCFTLNHQSIRGAAAVTHSIVRQRPKLPIFPVPTRLENAETDKLKVALDFARQVFAPFLMHVQTDKREIRPELHLQYWNDVETPYRTFYAFEEVPAAFKDETGSHGTILASTERLARWLSGGEASALRSPDEKVCKQVVTAYAFVQDKAVTFERDVPARGLLDRLRDWDDGIRIALTRDIGLYTALRISVILVIIFVILTIDARQQAERERVGREKIAAALDQALFQLKAAEIARQRVDAEREQPQQQQQQALAQSSGNKASAGLQDVRIREATAHPSNKDFTIFMHYRSGSKASTGYLRTARELLSKAGFVVGEDTADSKVSNRPSTTNVGPLIEYRSGKDEQENARSSAAAERAAIILNSKLPEEFANFRAMPRPPRPDDHADQWRYVGVWF